MSFPGSQLLHIDGELFTGYQSILINSVRGEIAEQYSQDSDYKEAEGGDEYRESSQQQRTRHTGEHWQAMASSSSNVVGVHYRVGKKIGEGSFGVIFEGTNLLNNQQVAIKFVCIWHRLGLLHLLTRNRSHVRAMHLNSAMSIGPTRYLWAAVSAHAITEAKHILMRGSWYPQCLLLWPGRPS